MNEAICGIREGRRAGRPLGDVMRAEFDAQWLEDSREPIAHYNRRIAEHGLLSDDAGLL